MNYNFNIPVKNLAGETMKDEANKDLTAGKILAGSLVNQPKGNSVKYFSWALDMYNCKPIDLSKSEVKELNDFVEANEQLTVLAKAQILQILDKSEEQKK